ncbi:MAG: metalloprotease [archaeon]|nr:metalloprotease [archaeon]
MIPSFGDIIGRVKRSKISFGMLEIRDIAISVAVLTIAFTVILEKNHVFSNNVVVNTAYWTLAAFVFVTTSFVMHEMGHKFVAQYFGVWAEFRMYPAGLLLCFLSSLLGFLFAAPGAVYIRGYIDNEMNGKISAAGPAVNIALGLVSILVAFVFRCYTVGAVFLLLSYLNGFLALFNMIPVMPLDGSKILKWDFSVYIGMVGSAILIIVLCYTL